MLASSGIRNKDAIFERIIQATTIQNFISTIFYKEKENLTNFINDETNAEKIIDWLWEKEKINELLNLEHKFYLDDKLIVKYNKGKKQFAQLDELSVGQKCNALLIVALLKGNFPIIIDQPEDALDITSVWEDVSMNLRNKKDERQFIITTHNNCVAVASDSDKFTSLKSNGIKGFVNDKNGGVESSKNVILEHLEGGKDSYLLRNKKYLIN